MSYHALAFFMGLFGSLHCVAMCGPLMVALPLSQAAKWKVAVRLLVYQIGRISVYALLGLLMGVVGHSLTLRGWQQFLSLGSGIVLIGVGLFAVWGRYAPSIVQMQQQFTAPLTRWIGYWLYRPGGYLVVGCLNGFLPCGMVYMALAAALSADSVQGGGLFMLLFGLGTWPAMLLMATMGTFLKWHLRMNTARWLPVLYLLLGGWFVLRGANLDIPLLSPLIYLEGAILCG